MGARWRYWLRILRADNVEECKRMLKGEEGDLYDADVALRALVRANPPRIMAYLKEELGKVRDVRVRWYGLLLFACKVFNKDLIEEILEKVDYEGNELAEPLYEVCGWGDKDLMELLISKGAPVNGYQDESNERVYQMDHTLNLSSDVVEWLVRDPSEEREEVYAPLQIASGYGHLKVVKVLLSHGADVNLVGRCGTPLYIAARKNCRDIVDLLISEGASIIPSCGRDHTAFILDEIV